MLHKTLLLHASPILIWQGPGQPSCKLHLNATTLQQEVHFERHIMPQNYVFFYEHTENFLISTSAKSQNVFPENNS